MQTFGELAAAMQRVKDNISYFDLLLNAHPLQKKALLSSSSDPQLDLLSEVLHNILKTLPLTLDEQRSLNRRRYLQEIAAIRRTHKYRRQRVKKHKLQIIKVLEQYSRELNDLINTDRLRERWHRSST